MIIAIKTVAAQILTILLCIITFILSLVIGIFATFIGSCIAMKPIFIQYYTIMKSKFNV